MVLLGVHFFHRCRFLYSKTDGFAEPFIDYNFSNAKNIFNLNLTKFENGLCCSHNASIEN